MKTIINGETQMSQDCEQRNHEHTDKESVTDYEAFERGLTALMDGDKDVDDDRLCERLVDYLAAQPWGACIDRDYASEDFKRTLGSCGRDAIVERVLDWAEELANAIRWPVAYTYIVTGKLPGEYRENTTALVVVVDRDDKVVGHRVVHWGDYTHIENDAERYRAFNWAIDQCAIDLGARSIFDFHCDGLLNRIVAVAHDPEQGPTIFHEREYK